MRNSNFGDLDALIGCYDPCFTSYVQSFKSALEFVLTCSEEYKVVIKADRVPAGKHPGHYNAAAVNEVAVMLVGDPSNRQYTSSNRATYEI